MYNGKWNHFERIVTSHCKNSVTFKVRIPTLPQQPLHQSIKILDFKIPVFWSTIFTIKFPK